MAAPKLTPAQLRVLRATAEGEVYRMATRRSLYVWRVRGRKGAANTTVDALGRAGLVEIDASDFRRPVAIPTDAGRALLATLNDPAKEQS